MPFFKQKILKIFQIFLQIIAFEYLLQNFNIHCLVPSMNVSGAVGPDGLNQHQKSSILFLHNYIRSHVDPPASNMANLTWDPILEAISMHYVEKCELGHNINRHNEYIQALQITGTQLPQNSTWIGENIAWGVGNCGTHDKYIDCGDIFQGIKRWYDERKNYDIVNNKCNDQCSLYTQMVWASTTSIGCGAKVCTDNKTILVCNYYPGGNQVKKRPYIIGDSCSKCNLNQTCVTNLCSPIESSEYKIITEIKQTSSIETSKPTEIKAEVVNQTDQDVVNIDIPSGWDSLETKCSDANIDSYSNIWCILSNKTLLQFEKTQENKFIFKRTYPSLKFKSISSNGKILWGVVENSLSVMFMIIGQETDLWHRIDDDNIKINKIQSISENILWILTDDNQVFYRTDISMENKAGLSWSSIGLKSNIKVMDLTCGSLACWILTENRKIYVRLGIENSNPRGTLWKATNSTMSYLYSGFNGYTIGKLITSTDKTSENDLYFWRSGINREDSVGSGWLLIKFPPSEKISIGKDVILSTQINDNLIYTTSYPKEIENDLKLNEKVSANTSYDSTKIKSDENLPNTNLSIVDLLHLYNAHRTPSYHHIETTTQKPKTRTKPHITKHTEKPKPHHKKKYTTEPPSYYEVSTIYTTARPKKHNEKIYQTLEEAENSHTQAENHKVEKNVGEKINEKLYSYSDETENVVKIKTNKNPVLSKANNEWLAEENYDIYSCCQVPDSLCAYPQNGCGAYIECEGNNPILKNCPPNTVFDGYTKVCVENVKSSYHCSTENTYPLSESENIKGKNHDFYRTSDVKMAQKINLIFNQNKNPDNKHYLPRIHGNTSDHLKGVLREAWFNMPTDNETIDALVHDERYPNFPDEYIILESFDAPPNVGDFYGQRLSSYYLAPETGAFVFYLSCDDSCELWVGKNESEHSLEKVAELSSNYSTSYREWNKYPEFQATLYIQLQMNKFYLIEAFMRETRFSDHISVGVLQPSGIVELPLENNLYLIPLHKPDIQELEKTSDDIL